jgi:hypothetical protein
VTTINQHRVSRDMAEDTAAYKTHVLIFWYDFG